ncbi:filamin-A-interacting protein 1-like isoform X2 [Chanos chanos]|uniref:Filamin-A-interacting protein 1-like isoform X2 n=1 Tax=Chanos chanos TaxID=29144 RepID=A0A6J2UWK2_CHACN|nr:filamin-A-interacting protein 1-like isoform X2 [Chanos chanos]
MRSKNSGTDNPPNGVLHLPTASHDITPEEDKKTSEKSKKVKIPLKSDKEGTDSEMEQKSESSADKNEDRSGLKDLSKDDLLKLLGIMEGELQAREDVIRLLRSERGQREDLLCRYGWAEPTKALQALHRDSLLINNQQNNKSDDNNNKCPDYVYHKPMAELERLQVKHKETYRRMLEQLLVAEKCHRRTVNELDTEKRKHAEYMNKSDDFTNLLEQERERLKRLLEQEKAYQVRKEKEHTIRLEKVRGELVKLKSFALMLVDERQLHLEQIDQQSQKIQDLLQKLKEKEQKLSEVDETAKEDRQKVAKLEAELEHKTVGFAKDHEEMTAKLANQEAQNRQLRQKLSGLTRKIEELEESNRALQKSAEELEELRDNIRKGEYGNSNLMAELENLRKKVLEMEGKDEEITKTEMQCNELRKKLEEEEKHSKDLKQEVERLQKSMSELEKLETAFSEGRTECSQLQCTLEKEKSLTKELSDELVTIKIRMKELESSELRLEKAELSLKDDLMKLKSFTVIMANERKSMVERLKSEERKREELNKLLKAEQEKVMEVTERLIEESKRLLKLKSEMEVKISTLTKEKDELMSKLSNEEEKNRDLSSKLCLMKQRIDKLEEAGVEISGKAMKRELERLSGGCGKEKNKVMELTLEIERLKNRLKQLEVVEGDLIKTEDEYDVLEKKFKSEQDKANTLSQQVEEMKNQIAFSKAVERGEALSHGAELLQRCRMEEAKTRDLQADVIALKEKIHELMNKEDQLSQLQVDYSLLQQRFLEEEDKKKSMSHEVLNLTKELEVTKRYSRAFRLSMNGRRMVDIPVTSTAVQTDAIASETSEDDTPAVFIKKSVQEENHIMNNLRQRSLKKPAERTTVRDLYSPSSSELTLKKSWIPWMRKKESNTQSCPEKSVQVNGESSQLIIPQKQGQPVHIRVTPDHQNIMASPEISSPHAQDFFCGTSVMPTHGLQRPRITIIPSTTAVSPRNRTSELGVPERAKSPSAITTISRTKSPEITKTTSMDRPTSPISITSVSSTTLSDISSSPEPQEMITGRAVFKVTPEKRTVPTPIKKGNSAANIVTTEDNKIHIHLGSTQFKKHCENSGSQVPVRPITAGTEVSTGTVLRSPGHSSISKTTTSKVTSSITITQVSTLPATPALTAVNAQSARSGLSRIPMPRGMKSGKAVLGALGITTGMRMETRAESQSMRIELKKSTVSTTSFQSGGKS